MGSDWRLLAAGTMLFWGMWGVWVKAAQREGAHWTAIILLATLGYAIVASIACLPKAKFALDRAHLFALIGGLCGGLGGVLFYRALEEVPASTLVPLSGQYVLVTAVLSSLFLGEPFDFRKMAGVLLAAGAIVLLSS